MGKFPHPTLLSIRQAGLPSGLFPYLLCPDAGKVSQEPKGRKVDWFRRKLNFAGSALFRGTLPPRAEEFARLKEAGIESRPRPPSASAHWGLDLRHPQWGEAELVCLRAATPPPAPLIEYALGLSREEVEQMLQSGSVVTLHQEGKQENLLRDRKQGLRFLRAVVGEDGLGVVDHVSQRLWSRAALDEELEHDAELDIEAIFNIHAVLKGSEQDRKIGWMHTHGLAEIGGFDFDILEPSPDVCGPGGLDLLRALAYAILEDRVKPSTPSFTLAEPGGEIRLVEVAEFNAKADAHYVNRLRDGPEDEAHLRDRAVLCDPEGAGFFSRWRAKVRPSRFLSGPMNDQLIVHYSGAATDLMGRRARNTYARFRRLVRELAEFEFPVAVKIGYEADGGSGENKEHLWFEVDGLEDGEIDATLNSTPYNITRMKAGERGKHPVDRLSDWCIFTPFGPISPRSSMPVRVLEAHRDEILKAIREAKEKGK